MNPKQREAAERLIDDRLTATMEWSRQVVDLLRELLAEPEPAPGYCKHCKQYTIAESLHNTQQETP